MVLDHTAFTIFRQCSLRKKCGKARQRSCLWKVDSVRYITQQEVVKSKNNGWKTLLGATIGGLVGNQFGGGTGKEVATAVGALTGAAVAQNQSTEQYTVESQLVELLIKVDGDKLINVIQDVDRNMLFGRGDEVRILYFDEGVRVDMVY